jgi:long-chain acyl-CoA synthetase
MRRDRHPRARFHFEGDMELQNLARLHRLQAERLGKRPAFRCKQYGLYYDVPWTSYRSQAVAAAAALVEVGVQPGDRVGLVGENSVTWLIADVAILTAAAVCVSPHAPLTARQIHYQLADAEVVWVFVSNAAQRDKVLQVRKELPALRGIVCFDPAAAVSSQGGNSPPSSPPCGEVISWHAFLQKGRSALPRLREELARREDRLGPEDLATVMYTSGTTGNPKGVMLTHGNLLSNAQASLEAQPHTPNGVTLSWLPYTHIYARTIDHYTASMMAGSVLALAESVETLVENLAEVQPTNMAAVPRFYEKVLAAVSNPDPQVTRKRLRAIFGTRIDWLSAGGAPLPLAVARAFHDAGLLLLQGYGLTESSPVISFNTKQGNKLGTVGKPIPGVEVRIAADGEILTRGPHVMKGYWKNPRATAEASEDGWLHTGDLGSLDEDGFLSITGRKKELLVLSNGKKVAPSNLEGLVLADPCFDQVMVCGEGRNFLTALVVPNWDKVLAALGQEGTRVAGGPEQLAEHPAVRDFVEKRLQAALTDMSRMEQIRRFVIVPRPFSVEADEMTVSLKLRRNVILAHYGERLEALYRVPEESEAIEA